MLENIVVMRISMFMQTNRKSLKQRCKHCLPRLAVLLLLPCCLSHAAVDLKAAHKAVRLHDYPRAYSLYKSAAGAGDADAQHQLASLYLQGKGTSQSEEKAKFWLKKSAAQRHPAAQFTLAMLVKEDDPDQAAELVKQAADKEFPPARTYLKRVGKKNSLKTPTLGTKEALWFNAAQNDKVELMQTLQNTIAAIDITDPTSGRTALFYAIDADAKGTTSWLIARKANPNHRDKYGMTPMTIAAKLDQASLLNALISKGGKVNATLPNGDTLLHHSIRKGSTDVIKLLLQKGIDVNVKNNEGWTALDLAQYQNNKTLVSQLKQSGARIGDAWVSNEKKFDDKRRVQQFISVAKTENMRITDAAKVVVNGDPQLVQKVLQKNPSLVKRKMSDGSTLLSMAIKESSAQAVQTVLNAGASVHQSTFAGILPIHVAARRGDLDIIQKLLVAGASPFKEDENGNDAVIMAMQEDHTAAARMLLKSINIENESGERFKPYDKYLLLAAEHNMSSIIDEIGKHALNPEADDEGRNAMWFAANNKNVEMINKLLELGIPADDNDRQGREPFFVAIESDCLECAKALLEKSDINSQTVSGVTPLMAAASNGKAELVRWLADSGADLELRNNQGSTALIAAAEGNHMEVVKVLVEKEVNVTRKNNLGFSAVDIAEGKNEEMFALLKSKSVLRIFD